MRARLHRIQLAIAPSPRSPLLRISPLSSALTVEQYPREITNHPQSDNRIAHLDHPSEPVDDIAGIDQSLVPDRLSCTCREASAIAGKLHERS